MDLSRTVETNRLDVLLALAVFLICLTVYSFTLCPTVYIGDSGEFVTTVYTLGIAHPPGYPLYSLLGRIFVIVLPFLDVAVRVNVFSAVCAAMSAAVVFFVAVQLTVSRPVAVTAALLLGFSATLWSRATIAEVYALNALFVSLVILFMVRWYRSLRDQDLMAAIFFFGLGLANHLLLLLLAPAVLILIVGRKREVLLRWPLLLALLALFVLGISAYLYLPIRASSHPPLNWGDPHTAENLFAHVIRSSQRRLFRGGEERLISRFSWFFGQLLTKEFWIFGGLAVVGIWRLRKEWPVLVFLVLIVLANVTFTVLRRMPLSADFDAYFITTFICIALLVSVSLRGVLDWITGRLRSLRNFKGSTVLVPPMLVLPAIVCFTNFQRNDMSENYIGSDYAHNILVSLKPNSILFTYRDEETFLPWYLKHVTGEARDVDVVNPRLMRSDWGTKQVFERDLQILMPRDRSDTSLVRQIIEHYIGKRSIFFRGRVPTADFMDNYTVLPRGLVIEVLPKESDTLYTFVPWTFHGSQTVQDERSRFVLNYYAERRLKNAGFWKSIGYVDAAVQELEDLCSQLTFAKAADLYEARLLLSELYASNGEFVKALQVLGEADKLASGKWQIYEYRGNIHFMMGDTAGALSDWKESLRLDPTNDHIRKNVAAVEAGRH